MSDEKRVRLKECSGCKFEFGAKELKEYDSFDVYEMRRIKVHLCKLCASGKSGVVILNEDSYNSEDKLSIQCINYAANTILKELSNISKLFNSIKIEREK